jgi:hypothetical protein
VNSAAEAFPNYDGYGHICLCKSKLSNSSHLLPIYLQVTSADFTNKNMLLCFFSLQLAQQSWCRWVRFWSHWSSLHASPPTTSSRELKCDSSSWGLRGQEGRNSSYILNFILFLVNYYLYKSFICPYINYMYIWFLFINYASINIIDEITINLEISDKATTIHRVLWIQGTACLET